MSWRYRDISFRPIDQWPGELTAWRRRSPFKAHFGTTVSDLELELRALDAEHVVMQIAMSEDDFKIDGTPKVRAYRQHPGVILAFDSKNGPLKFAVDTFDDWEDNLRAIALGMKALRAVDRYGVTKRGEQYTGWRAIEARTGGMDRETAERVLAEYGGAREALLATHPDRGGKPEDFARVQEARKALGAHA